MLEVDHAELQEERFSAAHSPRAPGESDVSPGETGWSPPGDGGPELMAACLWVDGAAAWLGGGTSCGQ